MWILRIVFARFEGNSQIISLYFNFPVIWFPLDDSDEEEKRPQLIVFRR